MPGFDDTIHATLSPSRWLRILSAIMHLLALIVVTILACSQPWFVLLAVVFAGAAVRTDRQLRLKTRRACTSFRWSADHRVQWREYGRGRVSGRCIEARSWGAAWVVLKWRADHSRLARTIVVPADAVNAETHRCLRARCRVASPAAVRAGR